MNINWGGCSLDRGWLTVYEGLGTQPCYYENKNVYPLIIFSPKNIASKYGLAGQIADIILISGEI